MAAKGIGDEGMEEGGERRGRGRTREHGNADICQEIDNSNKLVAKHSNRLPNGTIAHSTPGCEPNTAYPRRNGCTYVRGNDTSTTDTMRVLLVRVAILSAPAN